MRVCSGGNNSPKSHCDLDGLLMNSQAFSHEMPSLQTQSIRRRISSEATACEGKYLLKGELVFQIEPDDRCLSLLATNRNRGPGTILDELIELVRQTGSHRHYAKGSLHPSCRC